VALADFYDALTSKRRCRPALGHDVTVGMIEQRSNAHFDPDVVAAFVAHKNEMDATRRAMQNV
jgi:putative two-component system response regulator